MQLESYSQIIYCSSCSPRGLAQDFNYSVSKVLRNECLPISSFYSCEQKYSCSPGWEEYSLTVATTSASIEISFAIGDIIIMIMIIVIIIVVAVTTMYLLLLMLIISKDK